MSGIQKYLKAWKARTTKGSALVRYPTGTGKSGIIATTALYLAPDGVVVLVCPSEALCRQLVREVREKFWAKTLKVERPKAGIPVKVFLPSDLSATLAKVGSGDAVLVGTIQSLSTIQRDDPATYQELVRRTSLLIFDEGHREPARKWGDAARSLKCPSVLFTATPFRNDFAVFKVDEDHVVSLRFQDAVREKYIRDVDVKTIAYDSSQTFTDEFLKILAALPNPTRAIVRCQTSDSVRRVVGEFLSRGETAIGIHDNFGTGSGASLQKRVPDPKVERARIWVHQNKLLEGIDDPSFRLIAIFEPLGDARSLVQQIGRAIRNPGRKKNARKAVVLTHPDHGQDTLWAEYLAFEESGFDPKHQDLEERVRAAAQDQPAFRYLDRRFRALFNPFAADFFKHLRFPKVANISRLTGAWDTAKLKRSLSSEWEGLDRTVLMTATPDAETLVLLYAEVRNSPILESNYFIEMGLGYTLVHRSGGLIFQLDTGGVFSETVAALSKRPSPSDMFKLFGESTRATSVSMRNTDLGRHAFRSRSVRAFSLLESATGLVDYTYFCSTAEGYANGGGSSSRRRYVGVARGRLSEATSPPFGLSEFQNWAAGKASELTAGTAANPIFARFAREVSPPVDLSARHILLDIGEITAQQRFVTAGTNEELEIDDLAATVAGDTFTVTANGTAYEIQIKYDKARGRYSLTCDDLEDAYRVDPPLGARSKGLISHLNSEQSFRIVPDGGWKIYAHGRFIEPVAKAGTSVGSGLDLLDLFLTAPALASTTTEKGTAGSAGKHGWELASVFGVIDRSTLPTPVDGTSVACPFVEPSAFFA